jgi:hypothetical protein
MSLLRADTRAMKNAVQKKNQAIGIPCFSGYGISVELKMSICGDHANRDGVVAAAFAPGRRKFERWVGSPLLLVIHEWFSI